jgi:hypothetical protein
VTFDTYLHLFPGASSSRISLVPRCTFICAFCHPRERERWRINCASWYFQNSKCQPLPSNGGEGERTRKKDIKDLGNWICIQSRISYPSCGQISAAVKTASISAFHSAGLVMLTMVGVGGEMLMGKRLQHCDCSNRFPVPPLIADAPRCVYVCVHIVSASACGLAVYSRNVCIDNK